MKEIVGSANLAFRNTSQMRMFEGIALGQVESEVNKFMLTTARIYSVKHTPVPMSGDIHYHYVMVNYEP